MARYFADLILESSSTLGTGPYTLDGPAAAYRAFATGYVNGDTPYYVVRNKADTKYEVNRGALFTAPSTLARNVILSSNTNTAVPWNTGDLPLSIYCPRSADIDEGIATGWLATTRSAMLRGGLWLKSATPTATYQQLNIFDGVSDIPFLNIDTTAHQASVINEYPQNAQAAATYTLILSDAGKHIYHAVAAVAATWTIPANASVAYPIGTELLFVNESVNAVTIAITTDTLTLSPGGTVGSRTLATAGVATAVKVTATRWIISGTGLT